MSSLVINGDTSGSITLSAPAVAGSTTYTLPAATGTVMVSGNMPAVSAVASSDQSFGAGVSTKVLFQTEVFDTNNCFASSTFTPNVAGYYLISSNFAMNANSSNEVTIRLFKNGVEVTRLGRNPGNSSYPLYINGSYIISLNGTTDYVDIYCFTQAALGSEYSYTYFNGCLIRAA
jgi:hypothetical protein